jgi:hypothetical protein
MNESLSPVNKAQSVLFNLRILRDPRASEVDLKLRERILEEFRVAWAMDWSTPQRDEFSNVASA